MADNTPHRRGASTSPSTRRARAQRGPQTRRGSDWSARTPADHSAQARAQQRTLTDAQILARIQWAKNAPVAALWKADNLGDPSPAEGDLALCTHLARWTGPDEPRIDGLFRQSGRYRDEWDAIHDPAAEGSTLTYGEITIARAIAACDDRARAIARAIALTPAPVPDTFKGTDSGNAEHFAARWGGIVRWDSARRKWFVFGGHHWSPNRTGEAERLALEAIRQRQVAAFAITDEDERKAAIKWAILSENRTRRDHLLACAATVESVAVDGSDWDTRPWLLGVRNGVVDLETGRLRAGDPADGITKVAPVVYDPRATCPRFEQFMREIFASAPELVAYLQRCLGYALTGLTTEQVFWILWGLGANGKSTLLEIVLHAVVGARDYGWIMPFPAAGWSNTMTEYQKASLVGRRFVTASEVTHRGQLNEEMIKALTGNDTINARHPYGRPFQFVPVAKFFLRVNEKPIIRDQSYGMWRRPKLVPFTRTFPVDTHLDAVLRAEAAGILAWQVRGGLEWQRDGLRHPAIVEAATEEYRKESDPLAGFLADVCVIDEAERTGGQEAFTAYRAWCDAQQMPWDERLTQTAFGTRMKERFRDVGPERKVIYAGVGLLGPSGTGAPPVAPAATAGESL